MSTEIPLPSVLVENVLELLEEAGVPTEINDEIVEKIEAWEYLESLPYFGEDEHPEGHNEECGCKLCLSYL